MTSARGRLIFPFVVELAQLDTAATGADVVVGGQPTPGYDPVFRTPLKVLEEPGDQVGVSTRVETLVQVRAQIEPAMFEMMEMMISGESPSSRMAIVLHFRDLERANLVDSTGAAMIYKRDRLARILTTRGQLVREIPNPPGLYISQVQDSGFGPGGHRNLLLVTFEERDQSMRGA